MDDYAARLRQYRREMLKYVAELRRDFPAKGYGSLDHLTDDQIIAWLEKNRDWYVKYFEEQQAHVRYHHEEWLPS